MDLRDFSVKAVKSILFIFNLFIAFTGLTLVFIGLVIKSYFTKYEPFLDDRYLSASSLLITSGSIIFMVAFFGCCGAVKENKCMVIVYSVFLSVVMILELASGITGYVLSAETSEIINDKLNLTMYKYTSSHDIALLWDTVQADFRCCGLKSYKDWNKVFNNDSLPVSCCEFFHGTLDDFVCHQWSKNLYNASCSDALTAEVREHSLLLGGVGIGVIGLQFLGILFSCYLAKSIDSANYETV